MINLRSFGRKHERVIDGDETDSYRITAHRNVLANILDALLLNKDTMEFRSFGEPLIAALPNTQKTITMTLLRRFHNIMNCYRGINVKQM